MGWLEMRKVGWGGRGLGGELLRGSFGSARAVGGEARRDEEGREREGKELMRCVAGWRSRWRFIREFSVTLLPSPRFLSSETDLTDPLFSSPSSSPSISLHHLALDAVPVPLLSSYRPFSPRSSATNRANAAPEPEIVLPPLASGEKEEEKVFGVELDEVSGV